jgi:hypothetical protein
MKNIIKVLLLAGSFAVFSCSGGNGKEGGSGNAEEQSEAPSAMEDTAKTVPPPDMQSIPHDSAIHKR